MGTLGSGSDYTGFIQHVFFNIYVVIIRLVFPPLPCNLVPIITHIRPFITPTTIGNTTLDNFKLIIASTGMRILEILHLNTTLPW